MTRMPRMDSLNAGHAATASRLFLKLVWAFFLLLGVAQQAHSQDEGVPGSQQSTRKIKSAELRPGDVLLYHFDHPVGQLILLFQGGQYNHASIYDGQQVVEAKGEGIVRNALGTSIAKADYVDIFRLCDGKGCMGDTGFDPAPVKHWIDEFAKADGQYAYDELFLLAGVCLIRRSSPIFEPILFILQPVLREAVQRINKLIAQGKCIMICSELVYRCFARAGERYALKVPKFLAAEIPKNLNGDETLFVAKYRQAKEKCPDKSSWDGPSLPIPNFVTPRDLQESNLRPIGRLSKGS